MHQIPGPSVPQYNPIAPYSGTDTFASVTGQWLFWTSVLFSIPIVLSAYPSTGNAGLANAGLALALIPAIASSVIGFRKSWKLRVPGYRIIYPLGFFLGLPIVISVFARLNSLFGTGLDKLLVDIAGFSSMAMFVVSVIALNQAGKINPYSVPRSIIIILNISLTLILGTTIVIPFLPILAVVVGMFFVVGWYSFIMAMIIPVIIIIVLVSVLVSKAKKKRIEAQGQAIRRELLPLMPLLMYSVILACVTYIGIGFWLLQSIVAGAQESF